MTALLDALALRFPDSSRRTLHNWVREGRVFVDGEVVTRLPFFVGKEQEIHLGARDKTISCPYFDILYVDRWLVAIDKPTGLLSVPATGKDASAMELLRLHFGSASIFPVHRIDRDASGVLLFARGTLAQKHLDTLFETHDLTREYTAIVEGRMARSEGTWESYLIEKENYDVVTTTAEHGKRAITHFEVYRRSKLFSFLRCRLETGRKHQIRVHCKEAGHPIVGDERYSSLSNPLRRLGLHATQLTFIHPFTGKELSLTSQLPAPFQKLGAHLKD